MAYMTLDFQSDCLMGNTTVSVILPDKPWNEKPEKYYSNGKKYKVLWLLHGTFGDHSDWIRKSNIELYASERDLIVVMPSGLNANYANWEHFSIGFNMYDFLTQELMPLIYGWFPACLQSSRAVCRCRRSVCRSQGYRVGQKGQSPVLRENPGQH